MNDLKAIGVRISEFAKAYNNGDIIKLLEYYRDDLIKLRNGAPPETKSENFTARCRDV